MDSVIKGFLVSGLLTFCSLSYANCPLALPSNHPGFCESFKAAAQCRCYAIPMMPPVICSTPDSIYRHMIAALGPLQRACATQHETSVQECIDNWNCYRYGGFTSNGQLCSSTGHACA